MTAVEVLRRARNRVARGWTRRAMKRVTFQRGTRRVSYCAVGAISLTRLNLRGRVCVWRYVRESLPPGTNVALWNDEPGRTKRDVLALFDRAIARATKRSRKRT